MGRKGSKQTKLPPDSQEGKTTQKSVCIVCIEIQRFHCCWCYPIHQIRSLFTYNTVCYAIISEQMFFFATNSYHTPTNTGRIIVYCCNYLFTFKNLLKLSFDAGYCHIRHSYTVRCSSARWWLCSKSRKLCGRIFCIFLASSEGRW